MQPEAPGIQPGWKRESRRVRESAARAPSDTSLIEAIASGSEDALAELDRRYRRSLFAVVARILSCPADAEEVVQDVFLLVWRHAPRFRGDAQVTTWLHAIARNAAVTRLRRVDRTTTPLEPLDLLLRNRGDLASKQPNPERQAAAAEFVRQMWPRINKLPATHRAMIAAIVRHGSATKVAARQHVAAGTVKSRLHRVRLALRATLEHQRRSIAGLTID